MSSVSCFADSTSPEFSSCAADSDSAIKASVLNASLLNASVLNAVPDSSGFDSVSSVFSVLNASVLNESIFRFSDSSTEMARESSHGLSTGGWLGSTLTSSFWLKSKWSSAVSTFEEDEFKKGLFASIDGALCCGASSDSEVSCYT
jgi:hypothetical protein